jgi:hypothetical protein
VKRLENDLNTRLGWIGYLNIERSLCGNFHNNEKIQKEQTQ